MVAIVLGAGGSWRADLRNARHFAPKAEIIAVNIALTVCPEPVAAFCTLHPEKAAAWLSNAPHQSPETYSPKAWAGFSPDYRVPEAWAATSGLYAAQVALRERGARCVILAGVPLEPSAGSIYGPGEWSPDHVAMYRTGAISARREEGARIRSVSGWTRNVFGGPCFAWLSGLDAL